MCSFSFLYRQLLLFTISIPRIKANEQKKKTKLYHQLCNFRFALVARLIYCFGNLALARTASHKIIFTVRFSFRYFSTQMNGIHYGSIQINCNRGHRYSPLRAHILPRHDNKQLFIRRWKKFVWALNETRINFRSFSFE